MPGSGSDVNLTILGGRGPQGLANITFVGVFTDLPDTPNQGDLAIVTDVGLYGSIWIGSVTGLWQLPGPVVLGQSNIPITKTGLGSPTNLVQFPITANVLNSISILRLQMFGTVLGTDTREILGQLIPSSGSTLTFLDITSNNSGDQTWQSDSWIAMRTSNSQIARSYSLGYPGSWTYSSANVLGTVDITQPTIVHVRCNAPGILDSFTLETCMLTAYP